MKTLGKRVYYFKIKNDNKRVVHLRSGVSFFRIFSSEKQKIEERERGKESERAAARRAYLDFSNSTCAVSIVLSGTVFVSVTYCDFGRWIVTVVLRCLIARTVISAGDQIVT